MDNPMKAAKSFVAEMTDIDRSKHASEIFRDFCTMAYCAIAKTTCADPERRDALEAEYMAVVARYPGQDLKPMANLLGRASMALCGGGCDFLGLVAGEIGMLDARMGQFFTPYDVSRMMAEITLNGADKIIAEKGFITVSEPAAGAAGMVIAMADSLVDKGHDLSRCVWVDAVELSRSTAHMAFIQMSLRGIPGQVRHGNSLSLEFWSRDLTPAGLSFLAGLAEHSPAAAQNVMTGSAPVERDQISA